MSSETNSEVKPCPNCQSGLGYVREGAFWKCLSCDSFLTRAEILEAN